MKILLLIAPLLIACEPTQYALCEPDVKGCKILEVYEDPMQCGFVAMARNGKGYYRDNLECREVPHGVRWENTDTN
jgi:hypothetical protein